MTGKAIPRLLGVLLTCAVLLAACSSGGGSSTGSTATGQGGGGSPTVQSSPTEDSGSGGGSEGGGDSTSSLDGTWDGTWQSSNNLSGTFSVNWKEQGDSLNGALSISVPCLDGAKVTGTVNGSSIEFGSVHGQCQVDYKGSISGDRMSGTYTISGSSGGTWKASKA